MTDNVKAGLIDHTNGDQIYAEKSTCLITVAKLVAFLTLFGEATQNRVTDYLTFTIYNDHHPISADNSIKSTPICLLTNTPVQFVKEPGSTHSISFPPFYCWEQARPPAPNILM